MQALSQNELVGFVQLQLGSLNVQVPVRAVAPEPDQPIVSFHADESSYVILIRGEKGSTAIERAMPPVVEEAVRHLSRKLLN